MRRTRRRVWVWVALALALSLRLTYFFGYAELHRHLEIGGDANDFLTIAWTLAHTGHYGRPLMRADGDPSEVSVLDVVTPLTRGERPALPTGSAFVRVEPDGWRPPLWTAVLAGFLILTRESLTAVFLLRFALDGVSVLLFALILERARLSTWFHALGLVLFALHPTWLIYSNTLLSEPLSLLLLLSLALASLRALEQPTVGRGLALGAVAAATVLCHGLFVMTGLFSVGLVFAKQVTQWAKAVVSPTRLEKIPKPLIAATLAFVLPLAAWTSRNALVLGKVPLTSNSGNVLAMGWSEDFLDVYRNATAGTALAPGPGLGFLVEHWRLVPAITARKVVGAIGPFVEVRRPGILEAGRSLWWSAAFLPLLIALFRRGVLPTPLRTVVAIQVAGYLLMVVLAFPSIRYRAPLLWLDTLVVVATVSWIWSGARARWLARDPA